MERLEARRLLDGSGDLTQDIVSLIQSGSNGSTTLNNVTLGSFLTIPEVTVTVSGVSHHGNDDWSAQVAVSASSASLAIGSSFTGSITGAAQGEDGLTGSYTLVDQPLRSGSYALTAGDVSLTIPGTLDVSADGVAIQYDPTEAPGSTIATIESASATLIPLNNASLSVSDLAIRDDGFSLGDATIAGGDIDLGGVVQVSSPTVGFSGVAYTVGSAPTGTITVAADSAALLPGNSELSASLAGFRGTYTLGTDALTLGADSGEVAVRRIFDAKATDLGLTWDGTNASVDLESATLTSPLLAGVTGTLSDLHADDSGFSVAQADLTAPEVHLGGVLDLKGLDLGVSGLSYDAATKALGGTFTVATGVGLPAATPSVSILPGATLFTSTVTRFSASYALATDKLTVGADQATIDVGSSLDITADGLGFALSPTTNAQGQADDDVSVSVGSATASLPQEGVSGNVTGLTITGDGFNVASATLSHSGTTSAFGGKFTIQDPSVSLTNFGYSVSNGAQFDSDLTLSASEIDFNPTSSVRVAATSGATTPLAATISFTSSSIGHFTFEAGDVSTTIGPYLSLDAKNIQFDSAPAAGEDIAQFGSMTAEVRVGGLDVTGTGQDFAIDAGGNFVTMAGFGVSLDLASSSTGEIQWPSWLPITVQTLDISWPDFASDPTNFTLILSATVHATVGGAVDISGSVNDVVIDTGLLEQGKFPITGLSGAGLSVSGSLFGATASGSAFFDILDVDASGNAIAPGDTTTAVARRVFYGGIEAGLSFAGADGFEVRLGVSSLGPLDAFVEVSAPILLDPDSGLAVTDLYGEVAFDSTLQPPSDAHDLATNPVYASPTTQSLPDWEAALGRAVAVQASNTAAGLGALNAPVEIKVGATFFDEYATTNAFQVSGNLDFDTTGKFDISGAITLGDSVTFNGALYADLSQIRAGKGTVLLYAESPTTAGVPPLETIYGSLQVQAGGDLNLDGSTAYGSATIPALGTGSFSVEFFSRRDDNDQAESVVSTAGLSLGYDSGNHFVVNYGGTTLRSPAAADTAWHHWAATFDASTGTLTLYEDGAPVASMTHLQPANLGDTTLLVGKAGSTDFHGSIEAIRVWNLARSSTQIAANYERPVPSSTTGLAASWAFYAGPEQVSPDRSGQGNPLLLSGSTDFSGVAAYPSPLVASTTTIGGRTYPTYYGFSILVGGELDYAVPGVPGGLDIEGSADLQVDFASAGLDLTVTGSATLQPLGEIGSMAGSVHFDDANGSPKLYGALVIEGNLGDIPQFASAGLTVSAVGILRFNTTGTPQAEALQLPSAPGSTTLDPTILYPLPADSFSLALTGDVGKAGLFDVSGALYAGFSYASGAELDVALTQAVLTIGPAGSPDLTTTATGVLIINSQGLAASMTVTIMTQIDGVDLGSTLSMTVNTSGRDQSFTVPAIPDPNDPGQDLTGTNQSYSVPGIYAPDGVAETNGSGYLAVSGSGMISVENEFNLDGKFDVLVTSGLFRLDADSMSLSVSGLGGFSVTVSGGLLIESAGIAGAISASASSGVDDPSGLYQIEGTFTFEVNTTTTVQDINDLRVAPQSAELSVSGDVKVGPSGSQFDLAASVRITVSPGQLNLLLYGTTDLGPLGTLSLDPSTLSITPSGLSGDITLSGTAAPFGGVFLSGSFGLEFDTAAGLYEIHVGGDPAVPDSHADLNIGDGAFDLQGAFDLKIANGGFTIGGGFHVSVLSTTLGSGDFFASIYRDSSNVSQLALYAGLTLSAGSSFAGGDFSITASPSLTINTGSNDISHTFSHGNGDTTIDMAPHSSRFELDSARINAFGFQASGALVATISNGGFDIEIPKSQPISLSFLGLGEMQVYGDFNSNGTFSITGQIGYDVTEGPFELYGQIGATISSGGFSAWFDGGANIDAGALGSANIASVGASFTIDTDHIEISAHVHVLGVGFSFDASLGAYSMPPSQAGLAFYGVPTTAAAGSVSTFNALAYLDSSTPLPSADYLWTVTGPVVNDQAYWATGTGSAFTPTLGAPGTYTVTLYESIRLGLTTERILLKQSTIDVIKVSPLIASLNIQQSYATTGAPLSVAMNPLIESANPDILTGTWSVTKNGAAWHTFVGVNPPITFDAMSGSLNASIPDIYVLTLTVTDPDNGSATLVGTTETLDVYNLTVNSVADDEVTDHDFGGNDVLIPPSGKLTLRRAIDLINSEAVDYLGQTPTIRFAPSLAGQTIVLSQEEFSAFDSSGYGHGGSSLGIDSDLLIDGSDAPGLTITNTSTTGGTPLRLFYIGQYAEVEFDDLTLSGGLAQGNAQGGGAYIDNYAYLSTNNVSFLNNEAQATAIGGLGGNDAHPRDAKGGAVYVADYAILSATNSTFAGNIAAGSPAGNILGTTVAAGNGYGGAIYGEPEGGITLSDSTVTQNQVSGNSSTGGSGVYAGGGDGVFFVNTIVADDTGAYDLQGGPGLTGLAEFGSGNNNLIETAYAPDFTFPSDFLGITGTDPRLGLLARRGPSQIPTFSLLAGSPAIDAGDDADLAGWQTTDARGLARVSGAAVDIGAFEVQPYVVTNWDSVGANSLAQAIATDDDGSPITFAAGLSKIKFGYFTTLPGGTQSTVDNGRIVVSRFGSSPSRTLSILGPGAGVLTLTGAGLTELFLVSPGVNLTISGLTLANGVNETQGGAVDNRGQVTLIGDLLLNNSATPYGSSRPTLGGAIDNEQGAGLTLIGDTFAGNTAIGTASGSGGAGEGGAVYNAVGATLSGFNDTFAGNTAAGGSQTRNHVTSYTVGLGGAIYNAGAGRLTNATLAGNQALSGAPAAGNTNLSGVASAGSDLYVAAQSAFQLVNSIAAYAISGTDIGGVVAPVLGGVSDIENLGTMTGSNDLVMAPDDVPSSILLSDAQGPITSDPLLRPLGNYGGPLPTMALRDGSPALGVALASAIPTDDERGDTQMGDLGAFQLHHYTVTNTEDSGPGSLRQTILDDVDQSTISFDPTIFGTPRVIVLQTPIELDEGISIAGPGPGLLTIESEVYSALNRSNTPIFVIAAAASSTISGISMADGFGNTGGAIENAGSLTLIDDDFHGNAAQGVSGLGNGGLGAGGAIYNAAGGSLTVVDSTFEDNTATGSSRISDEFDIGQGRGGAIFSAVGATLTVIDDTFTGNLALGGSTNEPFVLGSLGYGGAIDADGAAVVVNSTFVGDSAMSGDSPPAPPGSTAPTPSDGFDIEVESTGSLTLYNTILASGEGPALSNSGGAVAGGGNLVVGSDGSLPAGLIVSTANPLLDAFRNNSGPTDTYALLPGSPAIGTGIVGVAPLLDQRGDPRVLGGLVDIGAYQTQSYVANPSAGGPYIVHVGQVVSLAGTVDGTSPGLSVTATYTWTISGNGIVPITVMTASNGVAASFSATPQIAGLAAGTYQVVVRVDDGFHGAHVVTSAPTTLKVLPPLAVQTITLPTFAPAISSPFDQVLVTFTNAVNLSSLNYQAISLSLPGGPNLIRSSTNGTLVNVSLVPGTASTYQINGLAALMASGGQGRYTLTINAAAVSDLYISGGVGSMSASWIYDSTPPTSRVSALPATEHSPSFVVGVIGSDPAPATGTAVSGIASYDLYVSTNGGSFAYWMTVPASSPSATFTGVGGDSYGFQSFARDAAGNLEAKAPIVEAGTYVANTAAPSTQVTYLDASHQAFVLAVAGSAAPGNVLDHIDVYVSVDGQTARPIGKIGASTGTVRYEAIADGSAHTYVFYSIGVDKAGNVQPTPTLPAGGASATATFAAPASNVPIALTVDHGAPGRSFVRYVDLVFDNASGLADLISEGHVHLVKHALDGTGATAVPLTGLLSVVDHAIEIDFGSAGIGGSPTTTAGDGYYEIDVDGASQAFDFDRILGDVNGDGVVDATDQALVTAALNSSVPGQIIDVDGSGLVSTSDGVLVARDKGHKLAAGLHLDA